MTRVATAHHNRQLISLSLVGAIGMLLIMYVYFLNETIRNGIAIDSTQDVITETNSRVSELESVYFAEKKNATLAVARELGFEEDTSEIYISRGSPQKILTLRNEN